MTTKKYNTRLLILHCKLFFRLLLTISVFLNYTNAFESPPQLLIKTPQKLTTEEHIISENITKKDLPLKNNRWLFLHAYDASYEVESDGEILGTAQRQLSETKGVWKLLMSTSIKKWLLSLKSEEYSEFIIQDNQLITNEFYTTSKISFKKAKTISQSFNWLTKLETGNKNENSWRLPLDELLYDRMSHLLMLRADLLTNQTDFNYQVSYKGKHQTYSYINAGVEKVLTSFGQFSAIRLDRQKDEESSFSIWLSPELNYFPVKIAQFELDKPNVILTLNNLKYQ